jgi:hypothetical protein
MSREISKYDAIALISMLMTACKAKQTNDEPMAQPLKISLAESIHRALQAGKLKAENFAPAVVSK